MVMDIITMDTAIQIKNRMISSLGFRGFFKI